jgi:bifunctional DNA-binding transcriptional regulator/antitoxin component of YhaV-PrlF toxin-antitoxin module
LRKGRFTFPATETFHAPAAFLRRQLKLKPGDPLFLFVNTFAPAPDERLQDLYSHFGVRGELVINYALGNAYG